MPCDPCLASLKRLRARRGARPAYDLEIDAFVWPDERTELCDECAREYRVVLNVRTQLWLDELPSMEFRMVYDRFREHCPAWLGFRRKKPRTPVPRAGSATDEAVDTD